jgi:predicted ribosome quality control (RQC) complex YloA/Tae2 family protein
MALDGAFLSRLKHEIETVALDARVDKIAQPSRDEIILHLRWRGGGGKLLLSANAGSARVHFTQSAPENPKSPPMFCMLLRKHLSSARLLAVRQIQMDRILHLDFETRNELGDLVTITVAIEIMNRHSNIIVIDGEGTIIDAIKRVDLETSSVRQVLPGMRYALPPMQDKLNLFETDTKAVFDRLTRTRSVELSKALMEVMQGVSPLVCREIAHFANRGGEAVFADMGDGARERLAFYLDNFLKTIREYGGTPTMVMEPEGRPRDFSFIPVNQYGAAMLTKEYEGYSVLLDAFYARRDQMERMKQRSGDLLKVLVNTSDRIARKLAAQREELKECAQRDVLRMKGDLINANLYQIKKGDTHVGLPNLYDPDSGPVEIDLDIQLTPAQNAQRYYALYRKADTAEKMLGRLIDEGEGELAYVESVFDLLARADSEAALEEIRSELASGGYIRRNRAAKARKEAALAPHRYRSKDGFTILSGRNNIQNDRLTLKDSRNYDIWLHTQKIPGSHTVIVSDGTEIPKSTIEQACVIAAYNSKARESSKVPVDFTFIKNVRKPNGAKPGMVIYDHYETVIVDPDEVLVESLKI